MRRHSIGTPSRVALVLLIPSASAFAARPFLTREKGANGQLQALLAARGIATEELPCIAFQKTEGFQELCTILADSAPHPWVVITSPAAASFFAEAWAEGSRESIAHKPNIASVGAGSAKVLEAAGLQVDFLPSKADGLALADELPADDLVGDDFASVLFPSSALAADAIADGLAARGIRTRRINTYTTAPAPWSPADFERAHYAKVVTFGSPSAVRVWAERVGAAAVAVCIGETTAAEARESGFGTVIVSSRPEGNRATMLEAWAACCAAAVGGDGPPAARRAPSPRLSGCSQNEAWFTTPSSAGKYGRGVDEALAVLKVERGASTTEIKQAYRARARELHPDVCADPAASERFRELVAAYRSAQTLQPGSAQTHPCWDQLPEFYQHWALELGHLTAGGLEEWITVIGLYEDEDLMLVNPLRLEYASAGLEYEEPAAHAAVAPAEAAADTPEAEAAILEVLGYRWYLGNEQWRVRWAGGDAKSAQCESWERWECLTSSSLQRAAIEMRAASPATPVSPP